MNMQRCGLRGSSPRMRGAPNASKTSSGRRGIIPAYAGSTTDLCCARPGKRDHPRVCGEHEAAARAVARTKGSSPRMRGARG